MNKNICVFCGSRPGKDPQFATWAYALGTQIANNNQVLVFGGGGGGLMGTLAHGALDANGQVIGIIPKHLQVQEALVEHLSEVHFVKTMGERKQLMDQFADAYVIIPGGIGTLDELFDVWATAQTGFHSKPIILANWSGYYDGLLSFLHQCVENGFMSSSHFEKIQVVNSQDELYQALSHSLEKAVSAGIPT
jgi:uncharacterized protein (TIGR00730 family)